MSKSALASLTAQYTDSENEDDHRDDDSPDSQTSQASQVIIPKKPVIPSPPSKKPLPQVTRADKKERKKKRSKKMRRLVSYQDDTIISDDDGEPTAKSSESSEYETDSDERGEDTGTAEAAKNVSARREGGDTSAKQMPNEDEESAEWATQTNTPSRSEIAIKYAHYSFTLPPEPRGKPSPELIEKMQNLYQKMDTHNMDMNRIIQERKEFRNPSIYEKLIQFCEINEFGTNYPPEIYDPLQWGAESYYDELAKVQQAEMVKREKDRKDMDKKKQATALARKVEEEAKKRKSKWDQPAVVKPVVPTALTTTVTGTKGTVISAFGSLPKKTSL